MSIESDPISSSGPRRRAYLIGLLLAFLVGFLPMWFVAHSRASELADARVQLERMSLVDGISSAAFYAKRGEYETARQKTSAFFTSLLAQQSGEVLKTDEKNALKPLLNQRDDVITVLARSDPGSVERLFGIEHQVRSVLKQ